MVPDSARQGHVATELPRRRICPACSETTLAERLAAYYGCLCREGKPKVNLAAPGLRFTYYMVTSECAIILWQVKLTPRIHQNYTLCADADMSLTLDLRP